MKDKTEEEEKYPHEPEAPTELGELVDKSYIPSDNLLMPGGDTLTLSNAQVPSSITFHTGDKSQFEVLRFEEKKMFLHGVETECPQDVIDGMREWLVGMNWFQNAEKARKYDALMETLDNE
jgi:hypothetical protein